MGDERIYSRGTPVKVGNVKLDVIKRYDTPMFLIAAARGTFLIRSDYESMLEKTITLLNEWHEGERNA